MVVVFAAVLTQYLPWMLVPRVAFICHYLPIFPFIILCIVYVIQYIIEKEPETIYTIYGYLALVLALFIMFYPVLSGMEVSRAYVEKLRWFNSWLF